MGVPVAIVLWRIGRLHLQAGGRGVGYHPKGNGGVRFRQPGECNRSQVGRLLHGRFGSDSGSGTIFGDHVRCVGDRFPPKMVPDPHPGHAYVRLGDAIPQVQNPSRPKIRIVYVGLLVYNVAGSGMRATAGASAQTWENALRCRMLTQQEHAEVSFSTDRQSFGPATVVRALTAR